MNPRIRSGTSPGSSFQHDNPKVASDKQSVLNALTADWTVTKTIARASGIHVSKAVIFLNLLLDAHKAERRLQPLPSGYPSSATSRPTEWRRTA